MCPASRAKRIPRRQGPASKGNLFSWWFCSVSFRSDPPPCRLRGRRPAKRPRLAATASQPPRAGRVGQTSDRLTDHRPQFPLAGSPCQQTTGSTLFCSVVQCPVSTACALCFCPSDDVDFCRRHIDIDCPAVLVAVAKGRSTPDRPAIPQPSPPSTPAHHLSVRRLPFPSRWGPSVFDFASPSPVQSASRRALKRVRSHGSIPPLQPAHRCSSDPQPPSAIGPPSSSTASASSYPPTPQPPLFNNKASHRPVVVHQGTEREQSGCRRLRRRTSHVASPARGLLAPPTRPPLVVASVHLLAASSTCQPSPRCPVLCCPDLPRFQSCNRAIADRDWRPLPVVAGCRLNRPHSGSSAFLQDAFRPLFFFCAPASRKSRLALLQPVPASRSRFPPRCVSSVWPAYEESRRSHFSCLQILSHLMSP